MNYEINNLLLAVKELVQWYGEVVDYDKQGESIWFETSNGRTYSIFIQEVFEE
jgi:hypothetical protein